MVFSLFTPLSWLTKRQERLHTRQINEERRLRSLNYESETRRVQIPREIIYEDIAPPYTLKNVSVDSLFPPIYHKMYDDVHEYTIQFSLPILFSYSLKKTIRIYAYDTGEIAIRECCGHLGSKILLPDDANLTQLKAAVSHHILIVKIPKLIE